MSVIVTGMEMPDNCRECRLMVDYWCYAKTENGQPGPVYLYKRPDWCPLRPLPEKHGRLIDADAMKALWAGAKIAGDIGCLIDARPTIIEAEGENDG